MVWWGPKIMKSHEPLEMKRIMMAYNFGCVFLSFYIVKECVLCGYMAGYRVQCQPVTYSYDEWEMRIAKAMWWFYFSKCIEMLDTFFFIVRKKNSQLSFLHVYHHSSMFLLWWIGVKWVAGGQSWFGAMMNSFVHFIMYSYYFLAACGPAFHKYLWWKKYLTQLQLTQFGIGFVHCCQSLYFDCDFPKWMHYALLVYATSITSLFLNFYIHAYIKRERLPKLESMTCMRASAQGDANGNISGSVKTACNGDTKDSVVNNGHIENKKSK
ncbi:elongation of very long chain fatty acids protein 4-like [Anneissia japonica]|uniref:elongation of very long chain fatty acids protein 4-like n=1 Tax=Anneissia japonica TaxID=1529436 RepID=UPI0014257565|nr:elongation of very long chain fatty acids protein 4-like [Anneissia japonica]